MNFGLTGKEDGKRDLYTLVWLPRPNSTELEIVVSSLTCGVCCTRKTSGIISQRLRTRKFFRVILVTSFFPQACSPPLPSSSSVRFVSFDPQPQTTTLSKTRGTYFALCSSLISFRLSVITSRLALCSVSFSVKLTNHDRLDTDCILDPLHSPTPTTDPSLLLHHNVGLHHVFQL